MRRSVLIAVMVSALASPVSAQWFIPPPVVVAQPPLVIPQPPLVYQPPPVFVPPPPLICVVVGAPWAWLNLRTFPNGPIITAMPPGTPLTLIGPLSGRWGAVVTPVGVQGWAFLPYTTCGGGY